MYREKAFIHPVQFTPSRLKFVFPLSCGNWYLFISAKKTSMCFAYLLSSLFLRHSNTHMHSYFTSLLPCDGQVLFTNHRFALWSRDVPSWPALQTTRLCTIWTRYRFFISRETITTSVQTAVVHIMAMQEVVSRWLFFIETKWRTVLMAKFIDCVIITVLKCFWKRKNPFVI